MWGFHKEVEEEHRVSGGRSCYVSRNESKVDIETGQLQIARKNLQLEGSVKQ